MGGWVGGWVGGRTFDHTSTQASKEAAARAQMPRFLVLEEGLELGVGAKPQGVFREEVGGEGGQTCGGEVVGGWVRRRRSWKLWIGGGEGGGGGGRTFPQGRDGLLGNDAAATGDHARVEGGVELHPGFDGVL